MPTLTPSCVCYMSSLLSWLGHSVPQSIRLLFPKSIKVGNMLYILYKINVERVNKQMLIASLYKYD